MGERNRVHQGRRWQRKRNTDLSGNTILLVDDHAPTLALLSRLLTDEGYQVAGARNGAEALTFLTTRTADLLISDVQMPGVDGLLLCRLLREKADTATLPIILCTANRLSGPERTLIVRLGVAEIFTKPIALAGFLARVAQVLPSGSGARERSMDPAARPRSTRESRAPR